MKQIICNKILLIGLLVTSQLKSENQAQPEPFISIISCSELHEKMRSYGDNEQVLCVINVLPKAICKDCKIPGTLNIPIDKLVKKVQNWPKNREIVIHCAGNPCPLGRHAYQMLIHQGFSNVWLFDGGLRCWKRENLPTCGQCRAGYLKG